MPVVNSGLFRDLAIDGINAEVEATLNAMITPIRQEI
jgi:hypothetical protein